MCEKEEGVHLSVRPSVTSRSKCVASYLQAFVQESANSQVAQESATQQVSALQQVSATQQVSACSHVASLHFLLLQHEPMVRAATATITNNTFFIFFAYFKVRNQKLGAKLLLFSFILLQVADYFVKKSVILCKMVENAKKMLVMI